MSYSAPAAGVPLVEIVIPVRNEQRELTDHVTRLVEHLRGGFPYAWLITIADNGSTDGTWSLAQELAGRHPGRVRAVHMELPGRGRALHAVWSASAWASDQVPSVDPLSAMVTCHAYGNPARRCSMSRVTDR